MRGNPDDGALEFVIVASIIVMVGLVVWRYGRLATTAIGDRLLVRNWLTERRVDRVDLDAIGFAGDQRGGAVYATLHDGTRLRLDALGSVTRNDRRIRRVAD